MLISTATAPRTHRTTLVRPPSPASAAQVNAKETPGLAQTEKEGRLGRAAVSLLGAGTTAAAIADAFPGFVYPSVLDASVAEQAQIMTVLDGLPLHQVSEIDTLSMVPSIASDKPGWTVFGRANDYGLSNRIQLSRQELNTFPKLEDTLIHEVGHTTDYSNKPFPFGPGASSHRPYGKGPHVTQYAQANPREDYAETYQEYHQRPERLRETNAEKYRDMEAENRPGFLQRMVDRKEFRETGKFIGDKLGPNQTTRHAVEIGASAAGAFQVAQGLNQWVGSAAKADGLQHATGILGTLSGAIMLSGVAPLAGVGVQAASLALGRSVKRGELSPGEVESTIALPVRPLESLFGRKAVRIQQDHRPGKVLAVAAGGAVGGTVGALAGPYFGVIGGYHVAGGLGGAVGLLVGGAVGFLGGTEIGGRIGAALAEATN